MWGTGASSTQCEGAAPASDWWAWERAGHAPRSLDGNGFATRYAEDFALLAELGLTHHRLSIEWARIEPERGRHDAAAIDHYRTMLGAAREAGIAAWVCLLHFTLPHWFADDGGFLIDANRTQVWARHVDFVAETFGDLVAGWQPVNEANYGGFLADGAIQLANAEAARRLRETPRSAPAR
jgi:beta-glucosidase